MSTVKSPLFAGVEEALEIKEFTSQMIDRLKKSFSTAPKRISPEQANKLSKHLDRIELNDLRKLVKANIPFVSTVARNKIYKKTGKFEELNVENTSAFNPSVHNKTLGVTTKDLDRVFKKLSNQAQSYVNELLRTGMGTRDAIKKAKQKFNEERRLYVEAISGLQKKADKSGMPYSILKQVYDRGMAAWKSGHRPGASQQQWAFARVNSFITKSSGTWGGADKDLAAKVKGEK
jgi:Zn-dependent M32 family carboxypeptidase